MALAHAKGRKAGTDVELGVWLDTVMRASNVDQVQLEALSGIDQTIISRAVKHHRASDRVMKRLAAALKVALPDDILARTVRGRRARGAPEPEIQAAQAAALTGASPRRPGFDVPIWHAFRANRGAVFLLQSAPSEFAWRPPCLSAARRAFMLRMPGTSMEPWRADAEPIYFNPDADPSAAQHALLQFDTGEPQDTSLICRLLAPATIGRRAEARVYNWRRPSPVPDAPVRKVIPAIEWSNIIPS